MKNKKILISGAGIAGPTLAYWLLQWGFEPTLLELAPKLRTGGYMIDFSGVGYEVAERMNLLSKFSSDTYDVDEINLVDKNGKKVTNINTRHLLVGPKEKYLSILRGDLAKHIYATVKDKVEVIFDNKIISLTENTEGVDVTFEKGHQRRFDLVIGADGLHSKVRHLVFGEQDKFENYLGYYVAAFTAKGYPYRDQGKYIGHFLPGRQVWRYALKNDETTFSFIFSEPQKLKFDHHDINAQKEILFNAFINAGWECPEILKLAKDSQDFYFDSLSQIKMNSWSKDRISLVGDACFAPSLLSGQGSSFSMAGAYILAGELKAADGDYGIAFKQYQKIFKPFIDKQQKSAAQASSWYAPKTNFGIWLRNSMMQLLNVPFISEKIVQHFVDIPFELPNYAK